MRKLLAILFLAGFPAFAATYYVSPSGSNSNSCTAAQSSSTPKLTVSAGYACATTAGDTVILMDGTYGNEGVVGESNYVVTVSKAGTSASPITVKAQNRGKAIIDGGNTATGNQTVCTGAAGFFYLNNSANYLTFDGLVFTRFCVTPIDANSSASNITVSHNEFKNIGTYDPQQGSNCFGNEGLYMGASQSTHGTGWVVDSNSFHDIGRTSGTGSNCSTPDHDHGIYVFNTGNQITNNIFYNITWGYGIQLAPGADGNIANNTFYNSSPTLGGDIVFWDVHSNMNISNNIFYQPTNFAIRNSSASGSGNVAQNNVVFGGVPLLDSGISSLFSTASGTITSDPLLVSPSTYNFQLQSTSPAKAPAGVAITGLPDDFAGVTRPSPPSIGAYEASAGSCVIIPATLGPYTQGQAVTQPMTASGTGCSGSWSATGLPTGLSMSAGTISGTVNVTGSVPQTFSASISYGSTSQLYSISVNGVPAITFSPNPLVFGSQAVGTTSAALYVTVTNSGTGPLNVSSVASPTGDFAWGNMPDVTCQNAPYVLTPGQSCTNSIRFTPTASGTRTGTLVYTDDASGSPHTLTLSGMGGACVITPTTLGPWQVGQAVNATLTASGSCGPTPAWSVSSGALPTGLSMGSSTGVISGTVGGSSGTFSQTITYGTGTQAYSITVNPNQQPLPSYGFSINGVPGQMISGIPFGDCSSVGHVQKINQDGTVTCTADATTGGSMVYPGLGVPQSTGAAWGTSLAIGGVNGLVQLNGSGYLPALNASLLTNLPAATALSAQYIDWNAASGPTSIANKPALATVATSGSATDLGAGTLPAGRMPALTGAVTTSAGAVATTLSATYRTETWTFNLGTDDASADLTATNIGPQGRIFMAPAACTVSEITVAANAGTPSVIVRKNSVGTQTNLLSATLATGAVGAVACAATGAACADGTAKSGTVSIVTTGSANVLAAGDWIETTSGVASTGAKRLSVAVTCVRN